MDKQTEPEQTWRQWDAMGLDGIRILDPDGFERGDPMMDRYVYSRSEFLARRALCTVGPVRKPEARIEKGSE